MSGKKCKHCGSSDIEVDPARGDAVCTNCGSVLEDNIIVAEIEFQENAHGGASTIGQFVSAETKGGATGFGRAFNAGIGQESREVTLRKAREGITALCQQLRLNQQCIDIACNFYKMALSRHLTIGRPSSHTQAACVYMTCRTEGTAHLLIDVSDAVPICCYQVGRTYFKLSRALCINIPPTEDDCVTVLPITTALTATAVPENNDAVAEYNDTLCSESPAAPLYSPLTPLVRNILHTEVISENPCLYILRFSSQLQFGEKSHEVSMTALRLVQRMKRDSIHSGRRPSGICGAALLIAARLHEFNRTPADVVRIVKVHESTLRKRLLEFGDTPSSALTLEEFMTVDLEEEQDPPAFRAARKRDKERLQKLMDEEDGEKELTELQKEIEHQLEKDGNKRKKVAAVIGNSTNVLGIDETTSEDVEASRFAAEDALDLIGEIASDTTKEDGVVAKSEKMKLEKGLGPDLAVIGLAGTSQEDKSDKFLRPEPKQTAKDLHNAEELVLDQKDEEYISSLIMSDEEMKHKALLWNKINAGYLKDQKIKEELRAKEREENKDKKKKLRGSYKKRTPCNAATAGEAIEKMIAEKKISSKINYDILKSLDHPGTPVPPTPKQTTVDSKPATPAVVPESPAQRKRKRKIQPNLSPRTPATPAPPTPQPVVDIAEDYDDEMEADPVDVGGELSLAAMLQNGAEDDYYGYEEY